MQRSFVFPSLLALLVCAAAPVSAQSVTPARDGTGTVITRDGDRYIITGGRRSGDGGNLFQSFERLGLNANEIATFMTQPGIANILGRVTGGDASVINGLLQVSGGSSNLYLINPAGILFGPNARLDISGSFTATTASGLGLGDRTFNAVGENSYADLVGTPDSYAFTLSQPGAIVNAGDLAVDPGESLSLLGGVVVNTGTLSAPGGTVTVAAIPGANRVRVSQDGSLLSLELEPLGTNATNSISFAPLSLPELLTGGNLGNSTRLTVDPDGTVRLAGTVIPDIPGTAVVSGVVNAAGTAAEINVLGDRVALLSANLNASGTNGGGNIRIGGDYQGRGNVFNAARTVVSRDSIINADALTSGNGGRVIVWADGTTWFLGNISAQGGATAGDGGFAEVSGAQNLVFDGLVNLAAANGQLGMLLLDPTNITISAAADSSGVSGELPTITDNEPNLASTININVTTLSSQTSNITLQATNDITVSSSLSLSRAIAFTAGGDFAIASGASISAFDDFTVNAGGAFTMGSGSSLSVSAGDISVRGTDVTLTDVSTSGGAVTVTASRDLTLQNSIEASGGDVTLTASGNAVLNGDITASGQRVQVTSANGSITGGGNIITRPSPSPSPSPSPGLSPGGAIALSASRGSITVGDLNTNGVLGSGGSVTATAGGSLSIGILNASSSSRDGGSVNITAGSNLSITSIDTNSVLGSGGAVTATAGGSLSIGILNTSGSRGDGGNVTLDSSGDVEVEEINAEGGSSGRGGTVDITAGRFFRATSSFTNRDGLSSSISAAGGSGPGSVTIRHGGNGNTPFVIGADFSSSGSGSGSGSVDTSRINGTAAAITDGVTTFRRGESFEGSVIRGNLQLITEDACAEGDDCFVDERLTPVSAATFTDNLTPQNKLQSILQQTGVKPALIYISFVSSELPIASSVERQEAIASQQITDYLDRANPTATPLLSAQPSGDDVLDLLLVLPDGKVIRRRVDGVTRAMVVSGNQNLLRAITSPYLLQTTRYLAPAQQLYQWMIAPLKDDLVAAEIENIAFVVDSGLRTVPMAVLHDGEQFLVEQYSIGMMPSLSLTDTRYQDIRDLPVLAMGASDFDSLADLPAVPLELQTVASESRDSVQLLNENFTLENLLQERRDRGFGIVHLATHAVFNPGTLENSFIQLGDRRLGLDQLRQLQFNNPPVELLVLSACQTALGDPSAELGFGGLAVQAGVRTVLASLWSVSDTGTLGFMSEFYHQLGSAPTRSEALRQTQLAMLRGEIRIENGQLIVAGDEMIPLPPDLAVDSALNFRHPYYWAAFTMIGNPW